MFRILALVLIVFVLAFVLLRRRSATPRADAGRGTATLPEEALDPLSPVGGASPAALRLAGGYPYDAVAVVAELVDLAVRGWLRISREPRLVGFRWRLVRSPDADAIALHPAQAALVAALFVRDGSVFELSEANARRLASGIEAHAEALRDRRARVDRPALLALVRTRLRELGASADFDTFAQMYGYALALAQTSVWATQLRTSVPADVLRLRLAKLGWYHGSGAQMLDDPEQINQALAEQLVAHLDQLAKPSGLLANLSSEHAG